MNARMAPPLFSLVVPTFNYGRFLGRAIDSALSQSGNDFELAVIDDGSTDDTPRVAASYGSRIRYVRQQRQGVFLACKRGLEETSGRFLVFFDADDVLMPSALAVLRREIERRPEVALVAGRHVNVTVAGRRESPRLSLGASRERNFQSFLLGSQFICTGAAAMRRDARAVARLASVWRRPAWPRRSGAMTP
jgi:glycosyltransferase involved in cell wall biosynthesis